MFAFLAVELSNTCGSMFVKIKWKFSELITSQLNVIQIYYEKIWHDIAT